LRHSGEGAGTVACDFRGIHREPLTGHQELFDKASKNLTAPVMQELNARVDLDKNTPAAAAKAYLQQFKLTQ